MRGPAAACVTATEAGTDEDCEGTGRVTKVLIDHYTRRPSLEDNAFRYIARQCNNALFPPGDTRAICGCDLAALLLLDGNARCFISGASRVYYFVDRKLVHSSGTAAYPLLGERFTYEPELSSPFPLREGDNAFLIASPKLCTQLADGELEELLAASSTADGWLAGIVERMGHETQFCATALFLPPAKKYRLLPRLLFGGKPGKSS